MLLCIRLAKDGKHLWRGELASEGVRVGGGSGIGREVGASSGGSMGGSGNGTLVQAIEREESEGASIVYYN